MSTRLMSPSPNSSTTHNTRVPSAAPARSARSRQHLFTMPFDFPVVEIHWPRTMHCSLLRIGSPSLTIASSIPVDQHCPWPKRKPRNRGASGQTQHIGGMRVPARIGHIGYHPVGASTPCTSFAIFVRDQLGCRGGFGVFRLVFGLPFRNSLLLLRAAGEDRRWHRQRQCRPYFFNSSGFSLRFCTSTSAFPTEDPASTPRHGRSALSIGFELVAEACASVYRTTAHRRYK